MTTETTAPEQPICPECGQDLTGQNIEGHINVHYPERYRREVLNKDAQKRINHLLRMAGQPPVREWE